MVAFGIENGHMWMTFAVILGAIILFAQDRVPIEVSAMGTVTVLLVLFYLFPVQDDNGQALLNPTVLLAGFASPVLFTILALLMIGQGLFQTGAIETPARLIGDLSVLGPTLAIAAGLLIAATLSAFLNNTPVVVIFIPILAALAARLNLSSARVLMPLSYITILGGMTTLIGSSSNLVAAAVAEAAGAPQIGFFDFAIPGLFMAAVGAVYVILIMPRLLRPLPTMAERIADQSGKQFIAQVVLVPDHPWVGHGSSGGFFPQLKDITVRMVQRRHRVLLPPFGDITLQLGDIVIIAATRKILAETWEDDALAGLSIVKTPDEEPIADNSRKAPIRHELQMAEAVVAPGSRLIGSSVEQAHVHGDTQCIVLGIERRSRMTREPMNRIGLAAGDVLLVIGTPEALKQLGAERQLLPLARSVKELPTPHHAKRASFIFAATVVAISSGIVPIAVAALSGAFAMVAAGCLTVRQAAQAFDQKIYLLIGAAFAMAIALQQTGGAQFLAVNVVETFEGMGPAVLLSALFLLAAILTNFLSNAATAALFAPIVVHAAAEIGVPPEPFIYGLIFALNCSFATPIAYQTNLIVMGPGHYRFKDFMIAGTPLILILWLAYSIFAPLYYGF